MVNIMLGSYSVPGEWPWLWVLFIAPQSSSPIPMRAESWGSISSCTGN